MTDADRNYVTVFNQSWWRWVRWEGELMPPRSLRTVVFDDPRTYLVLPNHLTLVTVKSFEKP